jgi:hypothetical protein
MAVHIANTHPELNFTTVNIAEDQGPLTLDNLDLLNSLGGEDIYLTSNTNLGTTPKYLHGKAPNRKTLQTENAISTVIIIVEKGNAIVDAFTCISILSIKDLQYIETSLETI